MQLTSKKKIKKIIDNEGHEEGDDASLGQAATRLPDIGSVSHCLRNVLQKDRLSFSDKNLQSFGGPAGAGDPPSRYSLRANSMPF